MRRTAWFLVGVVAMLLIGGYGFVRRPVRVPDVALGIDPQCTVGAMLAGILSRDIRNETLRNLLDIDDASLSMVANACIGELRREREAVLARAAAGSEPWRPRPGAVR